LIRRVLLLAPMGLVAVGLVVTLVAAPSDAVGALMWLALACASCGLLVWALGLGRGGGDGGGKTD
jgi:hypothetical protein